MPGLIEVQEEWVDNPFFVRRELWGDDDPSTLNVHMDQYYTFAGDYVGDKHLAYSLRGRGIIHFEKRTPDSTICTIGFSPPEGKWYGWSHRAIAGFGIGQHIDAKDDGSPCITSASFDEAKQHAKDFAESVS